VFRTIGTRWMDNDAYGHVNNVVYYSWFDTVVNAHLVEQGALDIHRGETIGLVIETQCNYFAALAFPQTVEAGLRVAHMGNSSVRYEVGLFAQGHPLTAARAISSTSTWTGQRAGPARCPTSSGSFSMR
jgi:acyl-CoA thioester hydrolase